MVDQNKTAHVKDVMSIPIISIKTNEIAQDAISKLKNKNVHKAIIFDFQEKLIGYTDIWKLGLLNPNMKIEDAVKNKELIISKISLVKQDKLLKEVMPELLDKGILVVVDDTDNKIGVITSEDIIKVRKKNLRL